jgi:hypothetical protein
METTLNIRKHNATTAHVVFLMGSRLLLGGDFMDGFLEYCSF